MVADEAGKAARSPWRVIARRGGRTLVGFAPETGRTHQIRVHAASGLGVPIVGDPVYGKVPGGTGRTMLLHAAQLTIPREKKPAIVAAAPLPPNWGDWRDAWTRQSPSRSRSMRPEDVSIPEERAERAFLAASGPGGQNVNKVATAVQLRLDVFALGLHPQAYEKLKGIAGSR